MQQIDIQHFGERFDEIIAQVEGTGCVYLIQREGKPVVRVEPIAASWDVNAYISAQPPTPPLQPHQSLSSAILAERQEGDR